MTRSNVTGMVHSTPTGVPGGIHIGLHPAGVLSPTGLSHQEIVMQGILLANDIAEKVIVETADLKHQGIELTALQLRSAANLVIIGNRLLRAGSCIDAMQYFSKVTTEVPQYSDIITYAMGKIKVILGAA